MTSRTTYIVYNNLEERERRLFALENVHYDLRSEWNSPRQERLIHIEDFYGLTFSENGTFLFIRVAVFNSTLVTAVYINFRIMVGRGLFSR